MLPRVTLRPRKAQPFFHQHPWVFDSAIAKVQGNPAAGQEVSVHAENGQFIARGLFSPNSRIRVRLYDWSAGAGEGTEPRLTEAFWTNRVHQALNARSRLSAAPSDDFSSRIDAQRVLYSEADGLSGLIVDRYGDWLLLQLGTESLVPHLPVLLAALQTGCHPRGIWLRADSAIREREGLSIEDGLIAGEIPPADLEIVENDLRFRVNLAAGQKTGFYLDQRDNRRRFGELVHGGSVLDVCCYSGGFAMNALQRGRADHVHCVDASRSAIETTTANLERNGFVGRYSTEVGDAFKTLERYVAESRAFDSIVLDPPKLAKSRGSLEAALRGYFSLNRMAFDLLPPGGLLVTCSCSGLVTHDYFVSMLAGVAQQARRRLRVLEVRGAAADHPLTLTCPETEYLKCYFCLIGDET